MEVKELEAGTLASAEGLLPRQSGSLEWRQSRGEIGGDSVMSMMPGFQDIAKL